jgi:hypothetical protein
MTLFLAYVRLFVIRSYVLGENLLMFEWKTPLKAQLGGDFSKLEGG